MNAVSAKDGVVCTAMKSFEHSGGSLQGVVKGWKEVVESLYVNGGIVGVGAAVMVI
jgi:hypothetical protein